MKPKIIDHIFNTHLHGHKGLWELRFENGKFISILEQKRTPIQGNNSLDAQGGMAIAPFVEPHIHLDTTQTAGDPRWNLSGTLFEGINIWTEKKQTLDHEDIKTRAMKTLKWQISQGIQYVRTHVDICDPQLKALKAILEIKQEIKPWVNLQIVAFPQEGILSYSHGAELLEESLVLGADCVGAIPHCEFTREYGIKSLEIAMRLAQKYGRMIDVHCDEIDDEQSRFLETLATLAYENSFGHQVTASHTTAMHSYNSAYMSRLFRILKLSNINFVSNPLVNIHLQGRFDDYPKRRGITRVKELLEHKINVCFGHDDILDPWYSLGTGNMLQVLHMGLHVCHMMGYQTINESLDLITTRSARTLQINEYGLQKGNDANLVILPVVNAFEAIRRQIPIQYSIRHGKILVENIPSNPYIFLDNPETLDYSYSVL